MNAKDLYATLAKISKDADRKEATVKQVIDCLEIAAREMRDTGTTSVDLKGLYEMLKKNFEQVG